MKLVLVVLLSILIPMSSFAIYVDSEGQKHYLFLFKGCLKPISTSDTKLNLVVQQEKEPKNDYHMKRQYSYERHYKE